LSCCWKSNPLVGDGKQFGSVVADPPRFALVRLAGKKFEGGTCSASERHVTYGRARAVAVRFIISRSAGGERPVVPLARAKITDVQQLVALCRRRPDVDVKSMALAQPALRRYVGEVLIAATSRRHGARERHHLFQHRVLLLQRPGADKPDRDAGHFR